VLTVRFVLSARVCVRLCARRVLKLGKRRLYVHRGQRGDGSVHCVTPYKKPGSTTPALDPLQKTLRKLEQKPIPSVKWLDKLAVGSLHATVARAADARSVALANPHSGTGSDMFLTIEFPAFKFPIVYHQKTCNPSLPEILPFKERDRLFVLHDPEVRRAHSLTLQLTCSGCALVR
jgi:hypothetical protein